MSYWGGDGRSARSPRYRYDGADRPTTIEYPSGRSISSSYDDAGRLTATTAGGQTRSYSYDPAGRLTTAAGSDATSLGFGYNSLGQLATATSPAGQSSYTYTAGHRLASRTTPAGATTFRYNSRGLLDHVGGPVNRGLAYDSVDRPTTVTTGETRGYTNTGQIAATGGGNDAAYTYTPDGQVETITRPVPFSGERAVTAYRYDTAGRLVHATTTTGVRTSTDHAYTYDADSNRTSTASYIDANHAQGRPTTGGQACGPGGEPSRATDGDPTQKWCTFSGTQTGRTLTVDLGEARSIGSFTVRHASSAGEYWKYNTRDFDIETSTDGQTWTTAVQARGNTAATTTHPLTAPVTARQVRLKIITPSNAYWWEDSATRIYEFEAHAGSDPNNLNTGKPTTGGPACGTNPPQDPAQATNNNPGDKWCTLSTSQADRTLTVDLQQPQTIAVFRIRHATSVGEAWYTRTSAYTIDTSTDGQTWTTAVHVGDNRDDISTHVLTTPVTARYIRLRVLNPTMSWVDSATRIYEFEAYPPLPAGQHTTTATSHDAADRPTSATTSSGEATGYGYDPDGHLSTATTATGTSSYAYNPFGELSTATTTPTGAISYTRDPLGRITTRTTPTTTETLGYDAATNNLTTHHTSSGSVLTDLIRTPTGDLTAVNTPGGLRHAITNLHGDLTQLRPTTGNPTYTTTYDPTGTPHSGYGTNPVPIGYQTQYTDPTTGWVDMAARHYNPTTATFTTPDTIIGALDQPTTLNRYLYGNADPINHTDPDGHWSIFNAARNAINKAREWAGLPAARTTPTAETPTRRNGGSFIDQVGRGAKTGVKNFATNFGEGIFSAATTVVDRYERGWNIGTGLINGDITVNQAFEEGLKLSADVISTPYVMAYGIAAHIIDNTTTAYTAAARGDWETATAAATENALNLASSAIPIKAPKLLRRDGTSANRHSSDQTKQANPQNALPAAPAPRAIETAPTRPALTAGPTRLALPTRPPVSLTKTGTALQGRSSGVNVLPSSGRTFVGTRGVVYDIPAGWTGRVADNGKGLVFQQPGSAGNANMIRIMDPTPKYPNGYARVHNQYGQPVDVFGKPGPHSATHVPSEYLGPWPGWPK